MIVKWLILAEGVGTDSKNAITAIGLNQNVFQAPELPATTKRAVIARLEDIDDLKGESLSVTFSVLNPSGRIISGQTASVTLSEKRWADIPGALDIPGEFVVNLVDYGAHLIRIEVSSPKTDPVTDQVALYVVPASAAQPSDG
jgi:hypothetical protein